MNRAGQHDGTPVSWWKTIGVSLCAVYGPFIVMAVYTLLFVACAHCKTTVCETLPLAPGLVVSWLLLSRAVQPMPALALWIASGAVSLGMVAGVSFFTRRGGRWRVAGLLGGLVIASALAAWTLALIRA